MKDSAFSTIGEIPRRSFLSLSVAVSTAAVGLPVAAATPESEDLAQHDLVLDGDRKIARRALVLAPTHVSAKTRLPVLVLLHGLGETGNELLGIHAWGERYGAVGAYERLRRPPLQRTLERARYLTDDRLRTLDAALADRPFRGMVLVCPVTPNPRRIGSVERVLDRYADWIDETLLPAVRAKVPSAEGPASTGLDGCSLGGWVGMEVFLRKPWLFGSFGCVQAAFNVAKARRYAERIAETFAGAAPRPVHVETSSTDPFRRANETLAERLGQLGVPHELRVPPGPHNQPWLREVGTLEMLLWHDRQLGRGRG